MNSKGTQPSYTCIHSPPNSSPIQAATQHWAEFPVLDSKSLLIIHFKFNSMYVFIPNCPFHSSFPAWQPQVYSLSLWVCFCFVNKFICIISFKIPHLRDYDISRKKHGPKGYTHPSVQPCLQQPRHGSNLNVCEKWIKKIRYMCTIEYYSIIKKSKPKQIAYNYTVEETNSFKGLDLIECLENYGWRFMILYRRQWWRPSPRKTKAKWMSKEALQIAEKRREEKGKGEKKD